MINFSYKELLMKPFPKKQADNVLWAVKGINHKCIVAAESKISL